MPQGHELVTRPLTRTEISQVLRGMVDTPTEVPRNAVNAAFWCTLENLTHWCNPDDVEAARRDVAAQTVDYSLVAFRIGYA